MLSRAIVPHAIRRAITSARITGAKFPARHEKSAPPEDSALHVSARLGSIFRRYICYICYIMQRL
jgi:hypothetical protein